MLSEVFEKYCWNSSEIKQTWVLKMAMCVFCLLYVCLGHALGMEFTLLMSRRQKDLGDNFLSFYLSFFLSSVLSICFSKMRGHPLGL